MNVFSYRCRVKKCPKQYRANTYFGTSIIDGEEFTLEEIEDEEHNHNVEPDSLWGLTPNQKLIVTQCFERNQGAPKMVSFIY